MSFETGAPPPPDHVPPIEAAHVQPAPDLPLLAPARPGKGYDATTAILPGPPPGTETYRLRATETTATDDPPTG